MQGIVELKQDLTDDLHADMDVYRQDHGGWHSLFKRFFNKLCSENFLKTGLGYGFTTVLLPMIPEKCPQTPNSYNLTRRVLPRYRREWTPEMQALIPPLVPSADKWRIDVKIYNNDKDLISMYRIEMRLINRFSSQ